MSAVGEIVAFAGRVACVEVVVFADSVVVAAVGLAEIVACADFVVSAEVAAFAHPAAVALPALAASVFAVLAVTAFEADSSELLDLATEFARNQDIAFRAAEVVGVGFGQQVLALGSPCPWVPARLVVVEARHACKRSLACWSNGRWYQHGCV